MSRPNLSRLSAQETFDACATPPVPTTAARLEALESRVGRIERLLGMVAGLLEKMRETPA